MSKRYWKGMAWGMAIMSGGAHAAALDEALCRGEYPVMLMTEAECRAHVRHVETLQARGDGRTLLKVQQEHARLLNERAEACRCVFPQTEGAYVEHTAALNTDC